MLSFCHCRSFHKRTGQPTAYRLDDRKMDQSIARPIPYPKKIGIGRKGNMLIPNEDLAKYRLPEHYKIFSILWSIVILVSIGIGKYISSDFKPWVLILGAAVSVGVFPYSREFFIQVWKLVIKGISTWEIYGVQSDIKTPMILPFGNLPPPEGRYALRTPYKGLLTRLAGPRVFELRHTLGESIPYWKEVPPLDLVRPLIEDNRRLKEDAEHYYKKVADIDQELIGCIIHISELRQTVHDALALLHNSGRVIDAGSRSKILRDMLRKLITILPDEDPVGPHLAHRYNFDL